MRFTINDFYYDDKKGAITKNNNEIQLTKIQKKLLDYFILHPNQTLSKQVLMDEVWQRVINDNSVNKSISKLRRILEDDAKNPKIIVTKFGHGISFEAKVSQIESEKQVENQQSIFRRARALPILVTLFVLCAVGIGYFVNQDSLNSVDENKEKFNVQHLNQEQNLLVLPTIFSESQNEKLQIGSNQMIKTTLTNLNVKGEILFDESNLPTKQLVEKHWKIESDLVILQTKVVKNGEVYDAVMQFVRGFETIKTIPLSANSLSELTNLQLESLSNFHQGVPKLSPNDLIPKTQEQKYLSALSYHKAKNYKQAKLILEKLLTINEFNYLARYTLAEVLLDQQKFDESLAHLVTLKSTKLYETRGGAIEFMVGVILGQSNQHQKVIDNIDAFLTKHASDLSTYRVSKLRLQKARAYIGLGDMTESLKQYKLCIIGLNDKLFPDVFASSFLGQATILSMKSSSDEVIGLFYKALSFAEKHENLRLRIVILNALSHALYSKNEWQKGIDVIKQSIALMEEENTKGTNDKAEVAHGLATLAMFLYERGLFTEASDVLIRLDKIAKDLKSQDLIQVYYFHQGYLSLGKFEYEFAAQMIEKHYLLATQNNSYVNKLNNTFLHLELLIQTKNNLLFKEIYDQRIKLFESESLERYRIYMHWFLARSFLVQNKNEKANELLSRVSELALSFNDSKLYVDSQMSLAKSHLKNNPKKSISILNNIEEYEPNPNPYLWLKTQALIKLDRKLDAFTALNQAKLTFNESWSAENQKVYEQLQEK